jgi:hypothetical protein
LISVNDRSDIESEITCGLGYGPVTASCEHVDAPSCSTKAEAFLDQLSDCKLLKMYFASLSYVLFFFLLLPERKQAVTKEFLIWGKKKRNICIGCYLNAVIKG